MLLFEMAHQQALIIMAKGNNAHKKEVKKPKKEKPKPAPAGRKI
jgi:hypothetical protein